MSNIHLLLLSPVVGNCSFFNIYIFIYIYIYLCISAFFLFMFVVLCVLACVLSAQLGLAEAPERVKQQRPDREGYECGG